MSVWDEKLCDERHEKLDNLIEDLYTKRDELVVTINGKFNKIMFGVFSTLLTIIAALVVMLVKHGG